MNKDQIKGAVKDAAGKVQREAGKAVGNDRQAAKGAARQSEGKAQGAVGDLKDAARKVVGR